MMDSIETSSLVAAIREWMVIFMLLINSFFSFFIKKCAHCWKLCTPCLLCSRLDHVFTEEKKGYIWELICHRHRKEISSLVLCHAHNKLVDVQGLCENCLFSFATINKSNAETYRLLVGKLGEDPFSRFESTRQCSCCYEPWVSRMHPQNLTEAESIGVEDAGLDKEDDKKHRGNSRRNHGVANLSHIGYRELKITSDTESEVPVSEDGGDFDNNDSPLVHEVKDVSRERLFITLGDVLASEKLINPTSTEESSHLASPVLHEEPLIFVPELLVDGMNPHEREYAEFSRPVGHGLEELDWDQPRKAHPPIQTDLISLEDTPDSCTMESKHNYVTNCSDRGGTERRETVLVSNDQGSSIPNLLELGDAYKLAISNRGRPISGLIEQLIGKDSSKVSEDLRVLLSQLSFTRGIEQTMNEVTPSPRFSMNTENGLEKRISLERNESGFSLDGSIVSEIDGESVIDRLKRQIDHDNKLMSSLYKELEEERNASAIAANQAMAMITRLQEEKATLNMEALQYLRMMEEQTEYDNEALQKANDIVVEKEKELQDMEDELEYYRNKYPNEAMLDNVDEIHDTKARDIGIVHLESSCVDCDSSNHENILSRNRSIYEKFDAEDANNSLFDFEYERIYIIQRLNKLEKMLHLFSNNGIYENLDKGEDFEHDIDGDKEKYQNQRRISLSENRQIEEENIELDHIGQISPVASFEKEIFDLNRRLESLEADKEFLEHTINSLRNEETGIRFVEEIASHLRELRKIGIRRDQTIT